MRSEARHSPEAEHTVWWLLLCRAVERDAAVALLRKCRGWLDDCDNPVELRARIDALLGGGEG